MAVRPLTNNSKSCKHLSATKFILRWKKSWFDLRGGQTFANICSRSGFCDTVMLVAVLTPTIRNPSVRSIWRLCLFICFLINYKLYRTRLKALSWITSGLLCALLEQYHEIRSCLLAGPLPVSPETSLSLHSFCGLW